MIDKSLNDRYSRQIRLDAVGVEGQTRLQNARVLVVGVGGLGAPVALYLAAAGVGTLGLIDPDVVDISNLQRQILFTSDDEGKPKVSAARKRLQALNPECLVEIYNEAFTAANAERIAARFDLLIDGSDNFSTKFLVNDVAHKLQMPNVYGAVDQFEGQVALFHSSEGACYRCLFPQEPQAKVRNCAETGVIGSLVGVIGSLQATMALHWVIAGGRREHPLFPPVGQVLVTKVDSFEMFKFQVSKNSNCPTCSHAPETIEFSSPSQRESLCSTNLEVSWEEVRLHLQKGTGLLVDVREKEEWEEWHFDGARHWPLSQLLEGIEPGGLFSEGGQGLEGKTLLFYCQHGIRSLQAVENLRDRVKLPLFSVAGGLESYDGFLVQG